jgi:capsid protein
MDYSAERIAKNIFNIADINNKSIEDKIIKILNDWKDSIDQKHQYDKEVIQRQSYDNGWALGYRAAGKNI